MKPLGSLVLFLACVSPLQAQRDGWYEFEVPGFDAAPTVVDASHLLVDFPGQDPASVIDARGRVVVGGNGHLYFSKTHRRARFWGVNFTFSANFPSHDIAEKVAARLAKLGVNVVRFHHMDYFAPPDGIWDPQFFPRDTQHLDTTQLDRWDYLVHQLKRHGIYVNVNLKVARHFGPDDRLEDTHLFTDNYFFRGVSHWNGRMIELQEDYARKLLDRKNPYTGLKYTEDPVVFCVEIANEDSLFGSLLTDGEINYIPDRTGVLPARYSSELDQLWNDWLRRRYGDETALRNAWDPEVASPDATNKVRNGEFDIRDSQNRPTDWSAQGLEGAQILWRVEGGSGPDGGYAVWINVAKSTGVNWHVQLIQGRHSVEEGRRYEVGFWAKASHPGQVTLDVMEGREPWRNYGLSKTFDVTTEWRQYRAVFVANTSDPEYARITFELGALPENTSIWIDKVEFRETAPIVLDKGESLAKGTILRPLRSDFGRYSDARNRDLLQFYYEVDSAYFTGMRRFLKNELRLKALVTGTAPWWAFQGDSAVQAQLDFVDGHYYWDHPWWPSVEAWSPTGWVISNTPQVNAVDHLSRLAFLAVRGKPFTVSEYNQSFPNRYALEAPLLIAAVAALQDWDAVYMFDYAGSCEAFDDPYTTSFFSLAGNPIKTSQMPIASRIFLGRQIDPARELISLPLALHDLFDAYARGLVAGDDFLAARGFDRANALIHRVRIGPFSGPTPNLESPVTAERVTADHGQLVWDRTDPDGTFLEIRAPGIEGAVGFLRKRDLDFGSWQVSLQEGSPDHCAVLLQSAGPHPLRESSPLLLSIWSEHENSGMRWNSTGTSVDKQWGEDPPIVRPVRARLTFRLPGAETLRLYALDPTGERKSEVALERNSEGWQVVLDTGEQETPWFELMINEPAAEVPYSASAGDLGQRYSQGEGEELQVGWAAVQPDSGDEAAWTPLLEYFSKGMLTSLVRIPAVKPSGEWRFPFRQSPGLRCALALVNPGAVPAHLTMSVFSADGSLLQQSTLDTPLGAGERRQFFLDEWLTDPREELVGSLLIQADQPVAVQILRAGINLQGEYFLTPVTAGSQPAEEGTMFLPQVTAGPTYSTELFLLNPTGGTLDLRPVFFTVDGEQIHPPGDIPEELSIAPGHTAFVSLPRGEEEFYGYLRLDRISGETWPVLSVVISQWQGDNLISEVGIPASTTTTEVRLPALERDLQWTAVALLNPSPVDPLEIEISLEFPGDQVERTVTVEVDPGERQAFFLREVFDDLPSYLNVPCVVRASAPFGLLALLGNFNQRGDFLLTALLDDAQREGPTDMRVIPVVLNGAGYRMLFYADAPEETSGVLSFRDGTGQTLPVLVR
ncbi:MAG TPA: carbohydrate binding domain-containing protein [Acidobacteriota bacterium]|nr:carbohydrate binding domain-containing protein [Acidobacteriota bacterium]